MRVDILRKNDRTIQEEKKHLFNRSVRTKGHCHTKEQVWNSTHISHAQAKWITDIKPNPKNYQKKKTNLWPWLRKWLLTMPSKPEVTKNKEIRHTWRENSTWAEYADFSWPKHYLYSMHIFLNIIKESNLKYKGRSKHNGFMYILHHLTEETLHSDICGEF